MKRLLSTIVFGLFGTALSQGAVVISELDLANDRVELVNTGSTAIDFSGWQWCNFVTGSPRYGAVTAVSTIEASLSSTGASLTNFGAGQVLVLSIGDSWLPGGIGELGLYTSSSFSSSSAIEDYVSWVGDGTRDSVADTAGIWTDNDPIDLTGIGAGDTIQLTVGADGNSAASYQVAASTLGATNIPEPAAGLLGLIGVGLLACRRRA